jgi:hypothetical protein
VSGAPANIARQADSDGALSLSLKVDTAPTKQVTLGMGGKNGRQGALKSHRYRRLAKTLSVITNK